MQKNTGIIRQLDNLGRIVLPVELRYTLDIQIGDPVEFFTDEATIMLRKYRTTACIFCQSADELHHYKNHYICSDCVRQAASNRTEKKPKSVSLRKPKSRSTDMLQRLKDAIEKHPTASQKELAGLLGLSQGRISQLKKQLG